jgi:hypothetical protein
LSQTYTGTVHGNAIVLNEPVQLPEGEQVEVVVKAAEPPRRWGEGIKRSAGGWAQYPELDEVFQRIHAERKLERPATRLP